MRKPLLHTRVTVKLRKSEYREEWYLYTESYPVRNPGSTKPKRVIEAVNRTITTPVWDTTAITGIDLEGNYKYKPKRDSNGIIQCVSQLDKEVDMPTRYEPCVSRSTILLWFFPTESRK